MQDPLNQRIVTYNAGIPAVVKSRADAGKHVSLVDMYGAFSKDAAFKTKYLADRLHPNASGYQVMSDVWNTAVHELIPWLAAAGSGRASGRGPGERRKTAPREA